MVATVRTVAFHRVEVIEVETQVTIASATVKAGNPG
jgi:hypothetical protein